MTQQSIDLLVQKLHPNAVIPKKANIGDAGLDLTCTEHDYAGNVSEVTYCTGIAVQIPDGYVGLLFPRSSIYKTDLRQCNAVGVIDSGYRGEIKVKYDLTRHPGCAKLYKSGDRIGQLIIIPIPNVNITEVEELKGSERGEGGFGSTGR